MGWLEDREAERRAQQKAEALAEFDKWREYLWMAEYGLLTTAFRRVQAAVLAVQRYRRLSNTGQGSDEEVRVAVRVAAATFAADILAATTDAQDAATVAWVVAGLRCPAQPFCTGCEHCQTVTAPGRPLVASRRYSI